MKCPLIVRIRQPDYSHKVAYPANCIREKCNWWNAELNQCDPTGLLLTLKSIWQTLDAMTAKVRD